MNKATRALMTVGLAMTAGATFSAAPAMAAPAKPAAPAAAAQSGPHQAQTPRRDRIVGYYGNLRTCDLAGRSGERRDRWDDYDCTRVRVGVRRGSWALQAHWGGQWHNQDHGPQGHGPRGH
ncbi:hypothetical protein ACWKSP_15175 [Micromonosporaceae bacterium Da 78-11]